MRKCILNTLVLTLLMIGIIFIPTFASDISEQIENAMCVTEYPDDTEFDDFDTVKFGEYPQFEDGGVAPIEWFVLEKKGDKALLLSKYILDQFDSEDFGAMSWKSSMRYAYLKNDFKNKAFNTNDFKYIIDFSNNGSIFVLSIAELENYFKSYKKDGATYFVSNAAKGEETSLWHEKDHVDTTWYCTRDIDNKKWSFYYTVYDGGSPGAVPEYKQCLSREGIDRYKTGWPYGIRPAIWVSLFNSNVKETTKPATKNGWVGDYYYQNGVVVKNTWVPYGNDMYYCGSSGLILKNQWIDNTYYVDNTGKMLKNTTTPDGYKVGADGKYIAETKSTQNYNVTNNGNSNLASQVSKAKCVTEYSKDTTVEQMDTVTFGSYPQSDVSGNTKEPIEWIVLEKSNNEVLLLSKYILDCKRYNEELKDVTWETCTLRQWFNNTFYNIAFSNDEKKSIIKSYVENKNNSDFGTSGGNSTNDYVYSLSIDECRKYFGDEDENDFNKRLATKGTEYAKSVDNDGDRLYVSDVVEWYGGNGYFCLRSPGRLQSASTYVGDDGIVFTSGGGVDDGGTGLRPLIRVKYK